MPPDGEGWDAYRVYVLAELKDHSGKLDTLSEGQTKIREAIANLKGRSFVWGVLGGAVVAGIVSIAVWAIQKGG